jgi:hypothetical protein
MPGDRSSGTGIGIKVRDLAQPDYLGRVVELMEKYSDVPMDYADATLVLLAEQLNVSEIITLDRRGFSVFRFFRDRPFRLVLDQI